MNFDNTFSRIKKINWELPELLQPDSKQYIEVENLLYLFLNKFVCFLKKQNINKQDIPLPYKYSPKTIFADSYLFSKNEQEALDDFFSKIQSWNKIYCIFILEWKKMCDKQYEITKNNIGLYDDLLKAIELGGLIRPFKGNLLIAETTYPISNWPNPFFDRCIC